MLIRVVSQGSVIVIVIGYTSVAKALLLKVNLMSNVYVPRLTTVENVATSVIKKDQLKSLVVIVVVTCAPSGLASEHQLIEPDESSQAMFVIGHCTSALV